MPQVFSAALFHGLEFFTHATATFAAAFLFAIVPTVFWPYFLSALVLVVGVVAIVKTELPGARGVDAALPFGRLLYCIPIAGFAGEHFTVTRGMTGMVPDYIPFHMFWVIFCGICLLAAALSIATKIQARLAATLLGVELFGFVALLSVPGTWHEPHNRIAWALLLRDSSFAAAAWAFAGSLYPPRPDGGQHWMVRFGQTVIGIAAIFFGVEHFIHPDHVPAIPLEKMMPANIPLPLVWMYLMGAVLIVAGACLLINVRAREAALALGVTVLVMMAVVYTPILLAEPSDIGTAFNYFMDTLMYAGAAFMLASALPRTVTKPVLKEGHAHA